ncbi:MAG: hypothetical protein QW524_03180 [Candidatus Woesearchaeota archaeon]
MTTVFYSEGERKRLQKYLNEAQEYVEKLKPYFGLEDFEIKIYSDISDIDNYAYTRNDVLEKKVDLYLTQTYFALKRREDRLKILLHELIHARIDVSNKMYDMLSKNLKVIIDEQLANDLTKGFYKLLETLQFKGDKRGPKTEGDSGKSV